MTRAEIAILETDLLQLSASVRVNQIEKSESAASEIDASEMDSSEIDVPETEPPAANLAPLGDTPIA
jgi:hypothetical protein